MILYYQNSVDANYWHSKMKYCYHNDEKVVVDSVVVNVAVVDDDYDEAADFQLL